MPLFGRKRTISLPTTSCKVIVGHDKVEFILAEDAVVQVPSFRDLLASSTKRTINILVDTNVNVRQEHETARELELINVYACAVKFNIENLMNDIVDVFNKHAGLRSMTPCTITALGIAELRESCLYKCLLRQLAYMIVYAELRPSVRSTGMKWEVYKSRDAQFEQGIRDFEPQNTLDLLSECSRMRSSPSTSKGPESCKWHVHTYSKACSAWSLKDKVRTKSKAQPTADLVINRPIAKASVNDSDGSFAHTTDGEAPPPYIKPESSSARC